MDVRTMSLFFALLAVAAQAIAVTVAVMALIASFSEAGALRWKRFSAWMAPGALPTAWLVAVVATAGSLYYSEVAGFVPCPLCWYQRIAMYPLVVVLGVATLRKEADAWPYVLPLTVGGGIIAVYHYQLQRFPWQSGVACDAGAPCNVTWVWELGYLSIPMMALSGFAAITALVLVARKLPPESSDPLQSTRSET